MSIMAQFFISILASIISGVATHFIIERLKKGDKIKYPKWFNKRVLIILVSLSIFGVVVPKDVDALRCHFLGQPYLKIVSLEPNAQITGDQVIVYGTSCGLAQRKAPLNIYLLVHPMRSGSKFVQANSGPPAQDGSWQQIAALGGLDEFEIWAIATDSTVKVDEYPLSQRFPAVVESHTIRIRRIM